MNEALVLLYSLGSPACFIDLKKSEEFCSILNNITLDMTRWDCFSASLCMKLAYYCSVLKVNEWLVSAYFCG